MVLLGNRSAHFGGGENTLSRELGLSLMKSQLFMSTEMTISEEHFGEKNQVVVSKPQECYMLFFSYLDLVKQATIFKDDYF